MSPAERLLHTCYTIDFETKPIGKRPEHIPEPVGLALRTPSGRSEYLSWGHPEGNNTSRERALSILKSIWRSESPVLMFNAKFDLNVCYERLGLSHLPWERVHDAMFAAYLYEPYTHKLGLKELAEDQLDMPPDEQDAVKDYILDNMPTMREKHPTIKTGKANLGAFIGECPADLVKPYAIGDVVRTHALFSKQYPAIVAGGMQEAYDRERRVLPIFMASERKGVRLDEGLLEKSLSEIRTSLDIVEHKIREYVGGSVDLNSTRDFIQGLLKNGLVHEDGLKKTKTGKLSTAKDSLTPAAVKDPLLHELIRFRRVAENYMGNHLLPWSQLSDKGRVHANWNQVSSPTGGTRTGRPSMYSPNLLNLPKKPELKISSEMRDLGVLPLGNLRACLVADEGYVWLNRDYSSQELRVFAEYERGTTYKMYQEDPHVDVHLMTARAMVAIKGLAPITDEDVRTESEYYELWRSKRAKALNFQRLFGGGKKAVASAVGIGEMQASHLIVEHDKVIPGIKMLSKAISEVGLLGHPVRTWGGRCYFRQSPELVEGVLRDPNYRKINYVIQGSAADMTKEAMIAQDEAFKGTGADFLLQVYDELDSQAPIGSEKKIMGLMREAMEGLGTSVAMLTKGASGPSWGQLSNWED